MITAIDPSKIKVSTNTSTRSASSSQDFSAFMGSFSPAGGEVTQVGVTTNGAAVTEAAMTGLSGAARTTGGGAAPYGYGTGLGGSIVGINTFGPDYAAPAIGGGTGSSAGGTAAPTGTGLPFENPSQDFLEKDYLLKQMNDSALNMLMLQARVQEDNRQVTLIGGIQQARHNSLRELIQHIGRT